MSEELPTLGKLFVLMMVVVFGLTVLYPVLSGEEWSIEVTKSITVLDYAYNSKLNQTTIKGIEHTKGWLGRDSFEEFVVDGAYSFDLEESYFLRIKTTHKRGQESKTELVLIAVESW